jgi:hypothetical protein
MFPVAGTDVPVQFSDEQKAKTDILLQQAEEELKSLTPEQYLAMSTTLKALMANEKEMAKPYPLPEAPVIAFTYLYGDDGRFISLTQRGSNSVEVVDMLIEGAVIAEARYAEYGLRWADPRASQKPVIPQAVHPQDQAVAGARPSPVTPQATYPSMGSRDIDRIVVTFGSLSGKLETHFYLAGLQYPLRETRGASTVVKLFDDTLGWTEAHFNSAAVYQGNDVAGLVADYEIVEKQVVDKNTKQPKTTTYWNVVRVHAK